MPDLGTDRAFRLAARAGLTNAIPPGEIDWVEEGAEVGLFPADPLPEPGAPVPVPKPFAALADKVVWHSDPERFARLYDVLWRLRQDRALIRDRADPGVAKLHAMEKEVRRCAHKLKAFVRFRDIGPAPGVDSTGAPRRSFAAWFEPTHHTLEPTAPFFARRFADMDWAIVTPRASARFLAGALQIGPGGERPDLPEDATEDLWGTYFQNIFNPARIKQGAMLAEMPKKYWHNMPETRHIPQMLADAPARVQAMRNAMPTQPPAFAARVLEREAGRRVDPAMLNLGDTFETMAGLEQALAACTRCPLHLNATQVVPGEGPADADLMIVAEQPGDNEDLQGRPLVGPAGKLFDELSGQAGLDRSAAFVTNAVKHFKFKPAGKRRIHQNPATSEISACKWWLEQEVAIVAPRLILSMGGTSAEALTGTRKGILKRRGTVEETTSGVPVFLTVHPSYLLRLPDPKLREDEQHRFVDDLRSALGHLGTLRAA
ncbi:MAG: UdgX family uracil-DNA binding protein [Paracoccaceae bacterium]